MKILLAFYLVRRLSAAARRKSNKGGGEDEDDEEASTGGGLSLTASRIINWLSDFDVVLVGIKVS